MHLVGLLIPLLFLASCSKTKAKYSEEKSETLTFSSVNPERGACLNATSVVTQVQKAVADNSKERDLVVEGSTKGPCPESLRVLNVDAKVIKKCDSYEDKADEGQTTYQWYIYDQHVVEGKAVPIASAEADETCANLKP